MKHNRILRRLVAGAAAVCLLAGLSGCSQMPPDAAQLLTDAQQILSSLDSYSVRMSVDVRATPVSGDRMEETSIALDTYTQITTGCQAMSRAAQYTVYKDWNWSLAASDTYQLPIDDEISDYYCSYNSTDFYHRQQPTVDYSLDLASFFGSDVTATLTRYNREQAYLLTGSLGDAHLEQLLPPDGAVAEVLQSVPLTATVTSYLDFETLEPLTLTITCSDPDGSLREALNCPGGTLNICRISLSFSSFNQLADLEPPELLETALELSPQWDGPPRDDNGAVVLQQDETQVHVPVPVTYTLLNLASTPDAMVLRQSKDGHFLDVTYRLSNILAEPDFSTGTVTPTQINGHTVSGGYTSYTLENPDTQQTSYVVEYELWTQLESGAWLQCSVRDTTANENTFAVDVDSFIPLLSSFSEQTI